MDDRPTISPNHDGTEAPQIVEQPHQGEADATNTTAGETRAGVEAPVAAAPPPPPSPPPVDPKLLKAYKIMLGYQFAGTAILVAIMLVTMLTAYLVKGSFQPPLLLLVFWTGMLGAFFSALLRLSKIEQLAGAVISPAVSQLGALYLLFYSLIPPLVGAIAAVVIYVTFAAVLLHGDLFPTISCKPGAPCSQFSDIVANYIPAEPKDYAKALVWGFLAGFSERLVPDMLQGFASKKVDA